MNTFVVALASFVFVAIAGSALGQEVDCSKRPNFLEIKSCCKVPEPVIPADIESMCAQYKGVGKAKQNPCYIECAFNVTGAISGTTLDLAKSQAMLTRLYPNNPEFADAFTKGLTSCSTYMPAKKAESKKPFGKLGSNMPKISTMPSCPMNALPYAMCAVQYVFANCPTSAWTASTACENAKAYASSCNPVSGTTGAPRMVATSNTGAKTPSSATGTAPRTQSASTGTASRTQTSSTGTAAAGTASRTQTASTGTASRTQTGSTGTAAAGTASRTQTATTGTQQQQHTAAKTNTAANTNTQGARGKRDVVAQIADVLQRSIVESLMEF